MSVCMCVYIYELMYCTSTNQSSQSSRGPCDRPSVPEFERAALRLLDQTLLCRNTIPVGIAKVRPYYSPSSGQEDSRIALSPELSEPAVGSWPMSSQGYQPAWP